MMKTQLGHYELIAELGRGGMGVVYKGYETSLNRFVAIKVFAESLAHDASVKERFLREARSMAALNDPHIIQIFFIGEDDGQTYFVMEFVDGESLGSLLKRESPLTPEQAAKVICQTAQGLATAHDKGVIHRDIKPGNLMVTSKGKIKIADFGIALKAQDFSKKLTSTGEFVGTPGYLSPEVCLSKPVDQRSDIFSLGVVLFECLAGRMPFKDDSPLGLMLEVVNAQIPDVRALNAHVDSELSRILAKMIAKDPGDRYQNCHELVTDLAKHPLVAKGGEIPLRTLPAPAAATLVGAKTPLSGQRSLPKTTPTPRSLPSMSATSAASLVSVGSTGAHMGERSTRVVQRSHNRRNAAVAAAAIGLVAVTGWAYRDRLAVGAFGARGDGSSVAASIPSKSLSTGLSNGVATDSKIGATPAALGMGNNYQSNASKTSETSARHEESIPDDAVWLTDVPNAFLKGNAYNNFVAALPLPDDTEQGTHSAIYSASYAYSSALLPAGQTLVSYGSPLAWHFGFSSGFGVGWYNYVYPRQIYIGPVRQIAFVGSQPAPASVIPFRANYLPSSAAQPSQVSNTAVIPSPPVASAAVQVLAVASSQPTSPSNLGAPAVNAHAATASPAAAVHPVLTPFIPALGANVSRPAFGASPAPTVASVSRPAVAWASSARVAGSAQRPQHALANRPEGYVSESRSQTIRSDQRRDNPLTQHREVALSNQNARRAAAVEAKAVQAQRVRAAREHKEKRHPA